MKSSYKWLGAAAMVLASGVLGGCYADVEAEPVGPPQPATEVEAYETYRPMSYNGYVVYYDGYARPYYYYRGGAVYVPRTYAHYNVLVGHYNTNRAYYGHWYSRYGTRYRAYRSNRVYYRR